MPAVSESQRIAAAIAKNHPEKLYARNKGMLSMNKSQLKDFATKKATSVKERLVELKKKGKFGGKPKGGYR